RRVHRGRHAPVSVAEATAALAELEAGSPARSAVAVAEREAIAAEDDDQPWHIVRMKEHNSEPMTLQDALFQMDLVGHASFLFQDKDSGRPSVVYRRRAYDYGVIWLAD